MKRKIFIFILAVVFVLSLSAGLSACGSSGSCSGDTAGTDGNTENNGSDDTEHVHNFIRTEAVAATCTSEGNIEYWYCADCGKYYSDADGTNEITLYDTVTSKLEHTIAVIEGVAATCTESGLTEGSYCSVCGEVLAEQEVIAATGHTLSSWIVTKEATATEMGSRHKVCTVCGEEVKAEPIIITKETEGLEYAEVLDGAGNVTGYKVTGVGSVTDSIIYVPAEYNSLPVTGVCQQAFNGLDFLVQLIFGVNVTSIDRYAVYNCENLTDIFIINEEVEIDGRYFVYLCDKLENVHFSNNSVEWEALGLLLSDNVSVSYDFSHDYVLTETVAATCVQDGYNVYVCADCGRQYSEVISAAGHSWSVTESVDATCEDYGYNKAVCTVCGEEKNLITEATGHTVEEWEVISEADCENNGLKIGTCTVCGESVYSYDYATGHVAGAIVYSDDSYCGEDKTGTVTCTVCGEILYSIGHNYVSTIKQATCEEDGLITYTCSKCGDVYTETLECGGHIEGEWQTEKAATCYSEGLEILCCLVCGKTINSQTISKTAHSYASTRSSSEIVYTCTVCGYSYTEELASDSVLYTVNFVSNGGTEYDSLTVLEGTVVELPEPECSGYEFLGWFTDESLTTLYDDSAVTQNLTLYAGWTMALEASGESNTIETSAPKDFTFDVVSDISLTKNNLSKYITVTDIDEKSVGIHISKTEGGVYTIAADSDYEAGATYIITIDPEMSFVDYDGYELWIIIECEDYYDIEYKSGVVFISVDEVYGCYSDDDNAYIYLYEDKLDVGDVAVIYDTSIYDIQYTLEVTVEGIYDRYYAYQVVYADAEEVFENYEVYSSGELSLEEFIVDDNFIEEIEEQFEESELYKQFVTAAEAFAAASVKASTGYSYKLKNFSIDPEFKVLNNKIIISIAFTAKFAKTRYISFFQTETDGYLSIKLVVKNELSFSCDISAKLIKFSFVLNTTNKTTVGLYATANEGKVADDELNYFKAFFYEAKKDGENDALDSLTATTSKDTTMGYASFNIYGFTVALTLKNYFTYGAVGEIGAEASVAVNTKTVIKYNNGLDYNTSHSSSASTSLYVMGRITVSDMLKVEASVSFLGSIKVALGVSAGPYFEMGGMFAVTVGTNGNAVVAGGYLEVGVKFNIYATVDISIKIFWWSKTVYNNTWTLFSYTKPIYSLGTKSMPLYYNVKNESFEIPLDVSQSYDLTQLIDSYIVYQDLTYFTTSKKSVTSSYSIIDGSDYFSLTSDGKLTLKSTGGNTSFTLQIKVYNGSIYKTVTIKVNVTHDEVSVDYVAPTCSSEGQTAYTYCSVCGEILSGTNEVIAKTDHTYGGYEYDETNHWQICSVCGEIVTEEHKISNGVCTVCGYEEPTVSGILEYTLSDDGTYYIVSGIGTCADIYLVIPETYNNKPVSAIAASAFKNQTQLISVYVPESVTSIGEGAFSGCSSLESITLPFVGGSVKTESDTYQYPFGYIFGTTSYTGGTETTQYYYGPSTNRLVVTTYYIPASLTELTIAGGNILRGAFYNCTSLTSITIPDSVTTIGDCVFYGCTSLTSVTIPESVTAICYSVFYGCTSLTSITIPDSVISIGSSAFEDCTSLTSITIPDSVTSIGQYAFGGCVSLTSVTIPDSIIIIGASAFSHCSSLSSVNITDLESWCNITFLNVYSNPMYLNSTAKFYLNGEILSGDIVLSENVTAIPYGTFKNSDITSVTIGNSVTSIGDRAFYECTSLTSITIGNSVTYIGWYAFYKCTSLTSVTIPDSVNTIDRYAFWYCTSLTSVTIGNNVTTIGDYAFNDCTLLTSITIPDSVTSIGTYAFGSCHSLTSVTIGNSVTTIGSYAFYKCTSLTSITMPDSVTYIRDYAFYTCTSLTSVTIGNSVTSICYYAFYGCTSLTSVVIGNSVTSIGRYAFNNCSKLATVYYRGTMEQWNNISVDTGNSYLTDATVYYYSETMPTSSGNYWHYVNGEIVIWDEYAEAYSQGLEYTLSTDKKYYTVSGIGTCTDTDIVIPSTHNGLPVTSICNEAFWKCTSLTSVTIPDSVTSIENSAFNKCTSLTSVTIGDSVTTIGSSVFYKCTSLTSVTIPDSVTSISYCMFYGCTSLTSVTIPDSVTSISYYAFYECTSLANVTIGNSVTTIGKYAFVGCTSLSSIAIPDSVKTIGGEAFNGCTSLSSVTIGNGVTSIGEYVFYNCKSLTSVIIPDSVIAIGQYAFKNCLSLTSITIPDSVISIGNYAFYKCTKLTSVIIGDSVIFINDDVFKYCSKLTTVYYCGTEEGWNSISIGPGNSYLTDATIYYYSETQPTVSGNYWHYVNGKIVIWDEYSESYSQGLEYTLSTNKKYYTVSGIGTCTDTNIVIPSTYNGLPVTVIGNRAFSNCSSLTSITIPDGVTSIGGNTFINCTSLTSVTIGNSVTSIGGDAFNGCTSLASIIIPDSVTSIEFCAFWGCTSLTSVTIGNSVTSIYSDAFGNCTSLTSINVSSENKAYKTIDGNLYSYDGKTLIQYAVGKTDKSFVIPDSVTSISDYAFGYCTSLTSITIPDSVTSIGGWAFFECDSLTSVTIGNSVTSIGCSAFNLCTSLTSVTIGNSVNSIDVYAFYNCTSLTTVYYNGTEEEWNSISIGSGNTYLTNATIYYSETQTMAFVGNSYILDWDELTYYANGKESAMLKSQAAKYVEYLTVTVNFIDSSKAEIVFDIAENSYITSGTYTLTSGYQLTGETFTFTDCTWDNEDAAKYIGNAEEIANSGLVTLGWDGTNVTILISINDLVDLLGNSTASALISLLGTCTASGYMQPV